MTETSRTGGEPAEATQRMQAIAGGAGEDGSACLLQREGRALAGAGPRGPVLPDGNEAPHAHQSAAAKAPAKANAKADEQLLQVQKTQEKMKEAYAAPSARSVSLASHVSDGMGIDRPAPLPVEAMLTQESDTTGSGNNAVVAEKDKVLLMAIEMFPPAWLLGLDRFYLGSFRTGIAKVLLSLMTLSIGGFIWGFIDFMIVVINALTKREAIRAFGMEADFKHGKVDTAFILGILDLFLLPVWAGLARYIWWVRKMQRMERLKENALKSPHLKAHNGAAMKGG